MSLTLLIAATGAATVSYLAVRDHRAATAARRGLLDDCSGVLDRSKLTHLESGFPQLSGSHRGRGVHVDLVLDTMTIRRLPQLWLSVTLREELPVDAAIAALVRPCGTEFYALADKLPNRLSAPADFPPETMLRGAGRSAAALLARLRRPMATLLADAAIKEIAVTRRGARIIRQVAEGRRGDYLLLRQCGFDLDAVDPATLLPLVDGLLGLRHGLAGSDKAALPAGPAIPGGSPP